MTLPAFSFKKVLIAIIVILLLIFSIREINILHKYPTNIIPSTIEVETSTIIEQPPTETNMTTQRSWAVVMSCPYGGGHSYGNNPKIHSKPNKMVRGIEFTAKQMIKYKSKVPLMVIVFKNEGEALAYCHNISKHFSPNLNITCISLDQQFPEGYGYSKISVIENTPTEELMWLDCDVLLNAPPEFLFNDAEYLKTGAMFWPDMGDAFDFPRHLWNKYNIDEKKYPRESWISQLGFDSAIIVLNKLKHATGIATVRKSLGDKELKEISFGDKDLWHVSWILTDSPFTYVPYVGVTGSFGTTGNFYISTRPLFNTRGVIVAAHQIGAQDSYPCPSFSLKWELISPTLKHINCPLYTLKMDLRINNMIGGMVVWDPKHEKVWQDFMNNIRNVDDLYFTPMEIYKLVCEGYNTWNQSMFEWG